MELRKPAATLPELKVKDQAAWARWLDKHHAKSPGVWLVLGKKGAPIATVSYAQAVEEALCFGWIDGQAKPRDATSWLQRFTPRRPRSIWSKINVGKVGVLIAAGKMKPSGLAAVELARSDGRWAAAYDSSKNAVVPADFQRALDAKPRAKAFFATVSKSSRFSILFRINTAKRPETRKKRITEFIAMLSKRVARV